MKQIKYIVGGAALSVMATWVFLPALLPVVIASAIALICKRMFGAVVRVGHTQPMIAGSSRMAKNQFGVDHYQPDFVWGIHPTNPAMGHTFTEDDTYSVG